jgi:ABC-type polysaccharide/polyol phosphate export permease
MFLVLMAVFSFLFARDPVYKLNLIVGLFLWDFFAEGTKTGLASLHSRGYLLTKARVPSWILVVTSISNALITLGVFVVVMIVFLSIAGHPPGWRALLAFAIYCVSLIGIVVGFSLGASVLFVRYRDLNQVWTSCCRPASFWRQSSTRWTFSPSGITFTSTSGLRLQ